MNWKQPTTALVAVLALASAVLAAEPYTAQPQNAAQPAAFEIQAKVLKVGKGWLQVEVVKVEQGAGLKVGEQLRILETAKTQFQRACKAVSVSAVKTGETIEVVGAIVKSGKTLTNRAATVTIMP